MAAAAAATARGGDSSSSGCCDGNNCSTCAVVPSTRNTWSSSWLAAMPGPHTTCYCVCTCSAGTAENWRPDYQQFTAADKGRNMKDWEGEEWLNIRSDNVRRIMRAVRALLMRIGLDSCSGSAPGARQCMAACSTGGHHRHVAASAACVVVRTQEAAGTDWRSTHGHVWRPCFPCHNPAHLFCVFSCCRLLFEPCRGYRCARTRDSWRWTQVGGHLTTSCCTSVSAA